MEKWQRDHIETNLPELIEDTECNTMLLINLKTAQVLSNSDIQTLEALHGYEKVMKFYDVLQKRVNSYMLLIEALKKGKQTSPVAILERPLSQNVSQVASPPVLQAQPVLQPQPVLQGQPVLQPQPVLYGRPVGQAAPQMNRPAHDDAPMETEDDEVDFQSNVNPLAVSVRRPSCPMTFADDSYRLPCDFKGFALILNITEFTAAKRNRGGASKDTQYMTQLWTQLGYKVTTLEGFFTFVEVGEILDKFKAQFTALPRNGTPVSCVIFIGSHGSFSKIESSDHMEINLYRHVIYKFDSQNCPQLDGMPKIFLIQACQRFQTDDAGPPVDRTEADSVLQTPIDDSIICFSTIPGYVANRDLYLGTWYTYCLAKVIMENAHCMDLLKMLTKTQDTMRKINADAPQGQLSTYMHLGIRTVYFNMSPN